MMHIDTDDAADTLRFTRPDFDDVPTDPDATSIYDLGTHAPPRYVGRQRPAARRRQIRESEEIIIGLRNAIAVGWDVGPELAHEQRKLAVLEDASC